MTREEFLAARDELNRRLEANRVRLAAQTKTNVIGRFTGEGALLAAAWQNGSLEWRRSIVGALLEYVEVLPGQPGRLPFNPERVKPVWKF